MSETSTEVYRYPDKEEFKRACDVYNLCLALKRGFQLLNHKTNGSQGK